MSDTAMICFLIIVICTIVNIASYIIAEVRITKAKKKLEALERRRDELYSKRY